MTLKQAMGDVSATSNSEKGGPGSLITTSSVSTTNGKIRSKGKMGGGGVKINENSRHHYLIDEDGEDEGTGAGQTGFIVLGSRQSKLRVFFRLSFLPVA